MSKKDEQIARMQGLMTYGIGVTTKKTPVTESIEGPDNKVYAIIREGSKYYIKSAPKGSELVTESFDYIGGFMNKKNNEFSSYNLASKNLELKVRSLNESYGVNKTVELLNPEKKESLMVEMTDSMKNSIARYREIMNNTAMIMNESATISPNNTGNPEAPKTSGFSTTIGAPFNQKAEAKLDSDLKTTANDPEKQSAPFGENDKTEDYKDAEYVPQGSVANQKPTGGKVVKVNESEEFEETIEECDEWGSCGLPSTPGVGEPGEQKPFNESSEEFVGFADDSIDEEDENIDLDDIDTDLEEPAEFEIEIDDIDTEDEDLEDEDLEDDIELDDDADEIEKLKAEIEDLRNIIDSLVDEDSTEDAEVEYELSLGDDELEDEEDFEDEEELEDTNMFEAVTIGGVELDTPFEIDQKDMGNFYNPEVRKNAKPWQLLQGILRHKQSEPGVSLKAKLQLMKCVESCRTIYECIQFSLKSKKSQFNDLDTWETVSNTLDKKYYILRSILEQLTIFSEEEQEQIDMCLNRLNETINGFSDMYLDIADAYSDEIENDDDEDVEIDDEWENQEDEFDFDEDNDEEAYANISDSVRPRRLSEEVSRLHVFGKHPSYRKKPMTLPKTDTTTPYEDWNDESVYSEQPFGSKIGDSAPFDNIVKTVMESLKKKL